MRALALADFIFRFFGAQTLPSFLPSIPQKSGSVFALIDKCSSQQTTCGIEKGDRVHFPPLLPPLF